MKSLIAVGLGPGGVTQLTQEARECIQDALRAGRLILRTRIHPTVEGWPALAAAPSLDHQYDAAADFGEVYDRIAAAVLEAVAGLPDGAELVYAVPGHPSLGEATVTRLRHLAPAAGVRLRLIPGLSFVDAVVAALGVDVVAGHPAAVGQGGAGPEAGHGLRVADALAIGRIDPTTPLLVCQVYSRRIASQLKLALGRHYPDEHGVVLVRAAGVPGQEAIARRRLFEIDRDGFVDHLTSLWVPPLAPLRALREPQTLQEIMARLRAPDGCPWDREQTHDSLRKYLLEETYETLEAIDAGDMAALEEELGDLLLQIVFHAQVADEAGRFDLGDVVAGIAAKMIHRHPHVFGTTEGQDRALTTPAAQAPDAETVLRSWEVLKRAERAVKPEGEAERSMLDGVPRAMPALAYAQAVQARAARVGLDWPDVDGVVDKVAEEARELAATTSPAARQDELGDLLFTIVNLARRLDIDAEDALRQANQKFRTRVAAMERAARREGKTLDQYDLPGLDALWLAAKAASSSE
ncbi:MAG TPA: nucleoside triphosphate pyrophosphohydrolase [Chloroflexota bacterium]|nr:nucleoside triphosphate pyrophosphohydrolase [Chloroflexota bacterium]